MSKHDLRARLVFHHTREAIEAHLTVVMASLAVARHLQDATGISIARIVRELRGLQEVTINLNGHEITAQPQITPNAASLLKSLQTPGRQGVMSQAGAARRGRAVLTLRGRLMADTVTRALTQ